MPFPIDNPCAGITVLGSELGQASFLLGVGSNGCLVYEAPKDLVCRILAALTDGGAAVLGSTKLVGADCKMYTVSFTETPLTANDSSTVDFTTSGTSSHTLTATVKISATAGNALVANADGLYVAAVDVCAAINLLPVVSPYTSTDLLVYRTPAGVCQVGTPPPVNITFEGDIGAPQTLNLLHPADPTRIVRIRGVAPLQTTISLGSANIDISLNRCLFGAYVPAGIIAAANYLGIDAAGCLVKAAIPTGESTTVSDTSSVDLTLTGTDISGVVKISATAGNATIINADGLYTADICTQLTALPIIVGAAPAAGHVLFRSPAGTCSQVTVCSLLEGLDTATDATVPVTAEVTYIRADGSCGRAPLPVAAAANTCADIQAFAVHALSPSDIPQFVGVRNATCELYPAADILCNLLKAKYDAGVGVPTAALSTDLIVTVDPTNGLNCQFKTVPSGTVEVIAPVGGTTLTIGSGNPLVVRAFNNNVALGSATTVAPGFLDIVFPSVCAQLGALSIVNATPAALDNILVWRNATGLCELVNFQNLVNSIFVNSQTCSITTSGDGLSAATQFEPVLRISPFVNNATVVRCNGDANDGVYTPNLCAQMAALPLTLFDNNDEVVVRNSVTGVCGRHSFIPYQGYCSELTSLALQAAPVGAEMMAYDPATLTCVRIAVPSGGTGSESTTVADTTTIDLTLTGFQITGVVNVSAAANQAMSILADGLYVPTVCSVVATLAAAPVTATTRVLGYDSATGLCNLVPAGGGVTVTDTLTVDMVLTGTDISANVLISTTAGNSITTNATGIYSPNLCLQLQGTPANLAPALATTTLLALNGASCERVTFCGLLGALDTTTDGTVPVGAEVVYVRADGSCGRAAIPGAAGGGVVTATDTTTIDFTITGTDITGFVKISATAFNSVVANADGLYVPTACEQFNLLGPGVADATSSILTYSTLNGGCARVTLCQLIETLDTATDLTVPATAEVVYYRTDGSCGRAPLPAGGGGGIVTATDTTTIDFTVVGTDITGSVIISPNAGNQVVNPGNGLFVPALCTQLNALDTVTDGTVPVGAEVVYVRADGTCGRAAVPGAAGGGVVTATDSTTIDFTITGTDITGVVLLSTDPDNIISIDPTGLYAPSLCRSIDDLSAGDPQVPATALVPYRRTDGTCGKAPIGTFVSTVTDSPAINLTILGNDLTAVLTVSSVAGNAVTINPDGVYVPDWCTAANNLGTVDGTVPATATVTYVRADGTCGRGTIPGGGGGGVVTATDTTTIDFTIVGTDITGSVIVDGVTGGNSLLVTGNGLYAPDLCTEINSLTPLAPDATTSRFPHLTGAACGFTTLCTLLGTVDTATDASVPVTAEVVYVRADGTCGRAPIPAAAAGGIVTATDSVTIDFTVTGTDITGVVLIDPSINNSVSVGPGGLFVANWCQQAGSLDTATDTSVPATAEVTYVRADNSCGRAPLPIEQFTIDTDSGSGSRITVTPVENPLSALFQITGAGGASGITVTNAATIITVNFDQCTALNGLDTATDATVPATADLVYVRADGTCGRAPAAAGAAPTACNVGAVATTTQNLDAFMLGLDGAGCLATLTPTPNSVLFAANGGAGRVGENPTVFNYIEATNTFMQMTGGAATGADSFTSGNTNTASGNNSVVTGSTNTSSTDNGIVAGVGNNVTGDRNITGGDTNVVAGNQNVVIGTQVNVAATTAQSFVGGFQNTVQAGAGGGDNNYVGGALNQVQGHGNVIGGNSGLIVADMSSISGSNNGAAGGNNLRGNARRISTSSGAVFGQSMSIGGGTTATRADNAFAVGRDNTITAGVAAAAVMGRENVNNTACSLVIGTQNEIPAAPANPLAPSQTDLAFSIGTGQIGTPETGFGVRFDSVITLGDVALSAATLPAFNGPNLVGTNRAAALAVVNNGGTRQLWFNNGTAWVQII